MTVNLNESCPSTPRGMALDVTAQKCQFERSRKLYIVLFNVQNLALVSNRL